VPTSSVASLEPETRASQLREESLALQAVRAALRRGDGAGALATLEATRARFPASVLGQEREALTIQALALAGQRDQARERARAFISKFPTSPHVPILARFADPGAPK
jgi:outer membrane protein assembly factor BamD (BamD/ComL family)